jgi:hypothetical protein
MVKITLFVFVMALVSCTGKSAETANTGKPPEIENVPKELTLGEIAEKERATIGKLDNIYRVNTSIQMENGQYIVINIQSVKSADDCVIIENVTPVDMSTVYIENSILLFFDKYGNLFSPSGTTARKNENDLTDIVLSSDRIHDVKFILLGRLDEKTNSGKSSIVFEIN